MMDDLDHDLVFAEFRDAFQVFDADNDGLISMAELRNMMLNFGQEADPAELGQIMKVADTDREYAHSVGTACHVP